MGHSVQFDVFSMSMLKEEIFEIVNEVAETESDSRSGLNRNIRWYDHQIQATKEDAESFIRAHDKEWYDQLAVPFRQAAREDLISKKTESLKQRISELQTLYHQRNSNIHYAGVKSKTVTCKTCESKLATAYLRSNHCPLCHADLRPESVVKDLETKSAKLKDLQAQLKAEERRLAEKAIKNSALMWLVKTEFHV